MSLVRTDPGWLVAVLPGAVVCTRGPAEVRLGFAGDPAAIAAIAAAIAGGIDAAGLARIADCEAAEADEVLAALRDAGALAPGGADRPGPRIGVPLAAALRRPGAAATAAWTADEALVLPANAPPATRAQAVAAFARGLAPAVREEAYAALATGAGAIHGDRPPGPAADARIEAARRASPDAVQVVSLADDSDPVALAPGELRRLGMAAPHRLGPLLAAGRRPGGGPAAGLTIAWAAFAATDRRARWPARQRTAHGAAAEADAAEVIARAEAAERRGASDGAGLRLVRAAASELDGAVPAAALVSWSARQAAERGLRAPGAEEALLWARAATLAGAPRWVPAARALSIAAAEGAPLPGVTSSGAAAHTGRAEAIERAACELAERDAFLWTWVQQAARERLDLASTSEEARARADACARAGWSVELVNLTLDTVPVVLAALHGAEGLALGAAARATGREAAERALAEAAVLAESAAARPARALRPEEVSEVEDHLDLYRQPAAAARAAFLWSSPDVIDVREVADAGAPAAELLAAIGEPVAVDLSGPATAPFAVVRLVVPGLVPLTFGWDAEPLGMARLGAPIDGQGGRTLGRRLDLGALGPLHPHPFA